MTYKHKRSLSYRLFEIAVIPFYALELGLFGIVWLADEISMQVKGRGRKNGKG